MIEAQTCPRVGSKECKQDEAEPLLASLGCGLYYLVRMGRQIDTILLGNIIDFLLISFLYNNPGEKRAVLKAVR